MALNNTFFNCFLSLSFVIESKYIKNSFNMVEAAPQTVKQDGSNNNTDSANKKHARFTALVLESLGLPPCKDIQQAQENVLIACKENMSLDAKLDDVVQKA